MSTTQLAGCGWCGQLLPEGAASLDFCNERHQDLWQANRNSARPLPTPAQFAQFGRAVAASMSAALVELGRRFGQIAPAFSALVDAAQRAGVVPPKLPDDPRARALALRRTRNTGPPIHQRPPRRIEPTRTRR